MSSRFDPNEGLIIVRTQLWGPSGDTIVRLALDTGATRSVVSWEVALLLGYDPTIVTDRRQMATASGVEFAPVIEVERIRALGALRRNFPVLCHNLPSSIELDGLLGLSFFPGRRLVVNFREGALSLA